jgi:hypothetical protein
MRFSADDICLILPPRRPMGAARSRTYTTWYAGKAMQRVLILASMTAAMAASVASSPSGGPGDIIGSAGPISVSLDSTTTTIEKTGTAQLSVNQPIEAGSGEVKLNATFPSSPPAKITMTIASDSGQQNQTDVDTSTQSEVDIGITTWDGCSGDCTENLTIDFDLTDTVDGSVDFSFTLDGSASVADGGEGEGAPGSISINVN